MKKSQVNTIALIIKDYFDNYPPDILDDMGDSLTEEIHTIANELEKNITMETIASMIKERMPIQQPKLTLSDIEVLGKQIDKLKAIKQPAQRTEEWYEYRRNRLTASDLATAIGENPYGNVNKLVASKCGYVVDFIPGAAIKHGVKYEPMATLFYERLNNVDIYEYGCIPHPTINHFGASPDGICDVSSKNKDYIGRMLEIKCPKSRKLNGFVPNYYELQIQGQLEVCELEYCDYLECDIQEISESEFYKLPEDVFKGIVFQGYNTDTKSDIYEYKTTELNKTNNDTWISEKVDKMMEHESLEYNGISYFYIREYDIILVRRDKERFEKIKEKINYFWSLVLKYREEGYEALVLPKKKNLETTNSHIKHSFIESD